MRMKPQRSRQLPARPIVMACVIALFMGLAFVGMGTYATKGVPPREDAAYMLALFGLGCGLGLSFACLFYLLRTLLRAGLSLARSLRPQSLRGSMIYSNVMALAITFFAFSLYGSDMSRFFKFYFAGVFAGIILGPLVVFMMKRNIVDDTMIVRWSAFDDTTLRESFAYWKEGLMVLAGMGAAFFLFRVVFGPDRTIVSAFFGSFLGMSLYCLGWVYLYEKRHNIRIAIQYPESHQPAGS